MQASTINGIQGRYTVKIDNNGYITGFGLISDYNNGTPTSSFIVLADRFSVVTPGQTPRVPFVVDSVYGVVIDTALIADATIYGAHIANAAIDTAQIADAAIVEALIGDAEVTNAKIGNIIQSTNYVPGVSGWNINKTGVAEFYSGTFRGTVLVGTEAPYIDLAEWSRPGSTYIDGNQIYTGDAYVDTLQIRGRAVTWPVSATGAWDLTYEDDLETPDTVLTAQMPILESENDEPFPVLVSVTAEIDLLEGAGILAACLQVYRDDTLVFTTDHIARSITSTWSPEYSFEYTTALFDNVAASFVDEPHAFGTFTYTVRVSIPGWARVSYQHGDYYYAHVRNRNILLMGLRR